MLESTQVRPHLDRVHLVKVELIFDDFLSLVGLDVVNKDGMPEFIAATLCEDDFSDL